MKNRLYQIDLAVQVLCTLFFFSAVLLGESPILYCLLFFQLVLGLWQLLSAAFWGLAFADFFRSQFLLVSIFALAGVGILLNLPEFRDSQFIILVARFGALVMAGVYFRQTFVEVRSSWISKQIA